MENKLWNRNYTLVFIGIIFIFSNFYLLLSCMPLAIKDLMKASAEEMSWVVSIYSLGVVLMRPFSGYIADRVGKRIVAFVLFLLFTFCTVSYLGINSLYFLLIIRFVHGLVHSIGTTAHAAMAIDFSPSHMKGQGIGYYGLAMCLAMVIAPALGLFILDNYSYQTLLILASICGAIGTLITFFIKKDIKVEITQTSSFNIKSLIELKAVPASILAFLISLCYSGIIAFIAVYLKERSIENGSIYFYITFAISMILSRPFIGKIIDKKGAQYLIYPSLSLFAIGMVLMGLSSNLSMVLLSGVTLGLSYGCIFPCFQTMAIQSCSANKSGSAMGTFFLFYDLGFAIGALLLAKISNATGYSGMYYVISVFILFIILTFTLFKRLKKIN